MRRMRSVSVSFCQTFTTKQSVGSMFKVQRSKSAPATLNLEPGTLNRASTSCSSRPYVVKLNLPPRQELVFCRVLPAHILRNCYVGGAKRAVGFGIRSGWIDAVVQIARRIQQAPTKLNDRFVSSAEMLARSVDDRPHAFLYGQILSIEAADSGESFLALYLP